MSVLFFSALLTYLLSVSTGQLPPPSQNFTEFPGNDRTQITQVITSICFLEDAQWVKQKIGQIIQQSGRDLAGIRSGRRPAHFPEPQTESKRQQCSVIPSLAATEKVNKVFSQIRSYVKEPSSTKDNKNDCFLTRI